MSSPLDYLADYYARQNARGQSAATNANRVNIDGSNTPRQSPYYSHQQLDAQRAAQQAANRASSPSQPPNPSNIGNNPTNANTTTATATNTKIGTPSTTPNPVGGNPILSAAGFASTAYAAAANLYDGMSGIGALASGFSSGGYEGAKQAAIDRNKNRDTWPFPKQNNNSQPPAQNAPYTATPQSVTSDRGFTGGQNFIPYNVRVEGRLIATDGITGQVIIDTPANRTRNGILGPIYGAFIRTTNLGADKQFDLVVTGNSGVQTVILVAQTGGGNSGTTYEYRQSSLTVTPTNGGADTPPAGADTPAYAPPTSEAGRDNPPVYDYNPDDPNQLGTPKAPPQLSPGFIPSFSPNAAQPPVNPAAPITDGLAGSQSQGFGGVPFFKPNQAIPDNAPSDTSEKGKVIRKADIEYANQTFANPNVIQPSEIPNATPRITPTIDPARPAIAPTLTPVPAPTTTTVNYNPASPQPAPTTTRVTNPTTTPTPNPITEEIVNSLPYLIPAVLIGSTPFVQKMQETAKAGAKQAVCDESQPGGCTFNAVNNATDGVNNNINAKDAVNQGMLAQILATLANLLTNLLQILPKINEMFEFMKKAFNNTVVDKAINALTLVTTLHNAAMLSTSIGQTLGDAISLGLATIGIKDPEGSPLDVNAAVGKTVENLIKGIIGADNYTQLKESWAKTNRIIQSGAAIIYNVRSLYDSARSLNELTGNNVGKIGNALRKDGVVAENAYHTMSENNTQVNIGMQKLAALDETASTFAAITAETYGITENLVTLQTQKEDFDKLLKEAPPKTGIDNDALKLKAEQAKTASQSPTIADADKYKPDI